jgi:hypothetical protein
MKFFSPAFLLFPLLLLLWNDLPAQQEEPRSIRIRKESKLAKAVFDNTELRLIVMDRYGNPRDNRIMSFKLFVKTRRETKMFEGFNNSLTGEMINYLNRQKQASKLFFTEITARDDSEHAVKLPDVIETWFPDCKNCEQGKKKR